MQSPRKAVEASGDAMSDVKREVRRHRDGAGYGSLGTVEHAPANDTARVVGILVDPVGRVADGEVAAATLVDVEHN